MKMLLTILTIMLAFNSQLNEKKNIAKAYSLCLEDTNVSTCLYKGDRILKGAGICEDIALGEVENFENVTSVTNDIYIRRLKVKEEFPTDWVIDLYSKNKIPMIILPYNISKEEVKKCAEISRDLDKPIFIEPDCGYDVEKYAEISEILKTTAPNIAIVWSIDSSCANVGDAYPKNLPVDWIGIDIKERCNEKCIDSQLPNVMSICRYFSEKPIMLNISVSHFSNVNRKYYLEDAINEMSVLYNVVADFKGVSVVNYISYSEENNEENNYKLSENSKLIENYKYCTDLLNRKKYFSQVGEVAYLINDKMYVNIKTAERLNLKTISSNYENLKCVRNFNVDNSTAKVFVKSKKM